MATRERRIWRSPTLWFVVALAGMAVVFAAAVVAFGEPILTLVTCGWGEKCHLIARRALGLLILGTSMLTLGVAGYLITRRRDN